MIKAAGIMFVCKTPQGDRVLFLKRSAVGDHAGEWCFPGGKIEDGETAEDAAIREAQEELGAVPYGKLTMWMRRVKADALLNLPIDAPEALEEVDFTTFMAEARDLFTPTLNEEHDAFAWADPRSPPSPLHPGCNVAIAKVGADELTLATMIMEGDLTSPQVYQNFTLFDVRITGTGHAYRDELGEHVWRNPDMYLNDRFLARCNGLPVIWLHPKGMLDTKEIHKRIVGTVFMPFIKGDEVRGIAKIWDAEAAKLMGEEQLSTSPGVAIRNADSMTAELEDGDTLLIEGTPKVVDHLAICEYGVWDKGGDPAGVSSISIGDTTMAETEKEREDKARKDAEEKEMKEKEDKARKDAEEAESKKKEEEEKEREDRRRRDASGGTMPDKLLEHLDNMSKKFDAMCDRMDKFDKRMDAMSDKPADELAADKKRKDAEEKKEEEEKEREDKRRKDAEKEREERLDATIRKTMQDVIAKSNFPKSALDDDAPLMADMQARFDATYQAFGKRALQPMMGESAREYSIRLAKPLQKYSAEWKELDLNTIPDAGLTPILNAIRNDAVAASNRADDVPEGQLIEVTTVDPSTGQRINTFKGKNTFIYGMKRPPRRLVNVNTRFH